MKNLIYLDPISKGLATGYQYLTEGYKSLTGGKDSLVKLWLPQHKKLALNKLGIDGLKSNRHG